MFVLVLAAENDETRQTVSLLIACLVGIAIALAVLTVWYWFYTDPKRQPGRGQSEGSTPELLDAGGDPSDDGTVSSPIGGTGSPPEGEPSIAAAAMARQTWDFVAAAKRAEDTRRPIERPTRPAAPRIAVPDRSAVGQPPPADDTDELAVVRRRREERAARGLSDEVWESVRRTVLDRLDG